MPRPEIKGLKYFPLDIGFFGDKKIRLLRGEHGSDGIEVYLRLLGKCYEDNGYYLPWVNDEDYALLADDTGFSEDKIRMIVSSCLRRSLFDGKLFKVGNVLTSRGIQRRYFSAIRDTKIKAAAQGRYTFIEKSLCLLTDDDFSELNKTQCWLKVTQKTDNPRNNSDKSRINSDKSPINPLNKTKLNETKGNKTQQEKDLLCRVFKQYEESIRKPSSEDRARLTVLCDEYTAEVLIQAIKSAGGKGKSVNYVGGILKNWRSAGYKPPIEEEKSKSYNLSELEEMSTFNPVDDF